MSWTLSIHGQSVAGSESSAPKFHAFDSDSDASDDEAAGSPKPGAAAGSAKAGSGKAALADVAAAGMEENKDADDGTGEGEGSAGEGKAAPAPHFMEGDVVACTVSVIHANLKAGEVRLSVVLCVLRVYHLSPCWYTSPRPLLVATVATV